MSRHRVGLTIHARDVKRSAVWPWGKTWGAMTFISIPLQALYIFHSDYWAFLTTPCIYVMFYAWGRQNQTDALGIRSIEVMRGKP